jgi:hypothetical protein
MRVDRAAIDDQLLGLGRGRPVAALVTPVRHAGIIPPGKRRAAAEQTPLIVVSSNTTRGGAQPRETASSTPEVPI